MCKRLVIKINVNEIRKLKQEVSQMRILKRYALLILCICTIGGCNWKEDTSANIDKGKEVSQNNNTAEGEEKIEMTEQQEEIFRSYGLTDEEINKMKEKGLTYGEQSFVDTAQIMLTYLEEKYGETFEVVGGDIPGLFGHEYWIKARACEGEYAGKKFNVYYYGESGCMDGYYAIIKNEEAVQYLEKLIYEKFDDVTIYPKLQGLYGNAYTKDTTGDDLIEGSEIYLDIIITGPNMSEEEFLKKENEIVKLLEEKRAFGSGSAFCFINKPESGLSHDDLVNLIVTSKGSNTVFTWEDYFGIN